jgi:hypothetical protein
MTWQFTNAMTTRTGFKPTLVKHVELHLSIVAGKVRM